MDPNNSTPLKTIKRFGLVAALLLSVIIGACSGGGGSYPSWGYGNSEAQSGPSQLSEVYAERAAASTDSPPRVGLDGKLLPPPPEEGEQAYLYDGTVPEGQEGQTGYLTKQPEKPVKKKQAPMPAGAPPVKVAILLPLSGQHKELGQSMLRSSQMALFDIGHKGFELMPQDTKGTQEGAAIAAQKAVNEGAQLILGPVFANSVRGARQAIQGSGINIVAFSTDWTLAGGNVFIMGFLPFDQVERITSFAASQHINRVGVLAPNTPYGSAVVSAYRSHAPKTGLTTPNIQLFDPDSRNLSPEVRNFAKYDERTESVNQVIRRLEEKVKQNPDDKESAKQLNDLTSNRSGKIAYDAVLLPVGGEQVRAIANLLSHYDLLPSRVRRLGTGLWDDKGLASDPALSGAWFAAPSPEQRREFERLYKELYGGHAPRLSSLAYDATALAAVLSRTGIERNGAPAFDKNSIANPNGFAGVDGIFRFRPDGLVERGLAVLTYSEGEIAILDEAPTTFQPSRF